VERAIVSARLYLETVLCKRARLSGSAKIAIMAVAFTIRPPISCRNGLRIRTVRGNRGSSGHLEAGSLSRVVQ